MERWQLDGRDLVEATSHGLRQLEFALHSAVASARTAGLTWQEVADALGTARQSAWRRFKEGEVGTKTEEAVRVCSFCGQPQDKVQHLVAAPTGASICGECLDVAVEMLATARARKKR